MVGLVLVRPKLNLLLLGATGAGATSFVSSAGRSSSTGASGVVVVIVAGLGLNLLLGWKSLDLWVVVVATGAASTSASASSMSASSMFLLKVGSTTLSFGGLLRLRRFLLMTSLGLGRLPKKLLLTRAGLFGIRLGCCSGMSAAFSMGMASMEAGTTTGSLDLINSSAGSFLTVASSSSSLMAFLSSCPTGISFWARTPPEEMRPRRRRAANCKGEEGKNMSCKKR
jgi:hypothetical protein